jgi:O-antigen/teichoic acid export membrane protein
VAWTAVGEIAGRGLAFAGAVILARKLGAGGFGVFALAQSVALQCWLFVDLGVTKYGIRGIAQAEEGAKRRLVEELVSLQVTVGVVCWVLFGGVAAWLADGGAERAALIAAGGYLVAYALFVDWVFKGLQRFSVPAAGSVLSGFVFLMGSWLLVRRGSPPWQGVALWVCGYAVGAAYLWYRLRDTVRLHLRARWAGAAWRGHLSRSAYFLLAGGLFAFLQFAPLFSARIWLGVADVGYASAAQRFISLLSAPAFLFASAAFPTISEQMGRGDERIAAAHRGVLAALAVVGALVAAGLAAVGPGAAVRLYGSEFTAAGAFLRVGAWIVPLQFMRYALENVILASGRERVNVLAPLTGAAVFFLVLLLTRPIGLAPIALSWVLAEAATVAVCLMIAMNLIFFTDARRHAS